MRFFPNEITDVMEFGYFSGCDSNGNYRIRVHDCNDTFCEELIVEACAPTAPPRTMLQGEGVWVYYRDGSPVRIELDRHAN